MTTIQRDRSLDLLRGYFLVVLMIDHLRFAHNPFYFISGRQSLWVTAAEGFVLISGFLVGMLRGEQVRREGPRAATLHILKRAGTLAASCAVLTIVFRLISEVSGYWPEVPNADVHGGLPRAIWDAIDLSYVYGDHQLLAAYALWMTFAPLAIIAMVRGYTWALAGASVILWAIALRYESVHWSNTVQSDASWQLLFVAGMIAGFHHGKLRAWWQARAHATHNRALVGGALLTIAILAVSAFRRDLPTHVERVLFHHDRLGPGRAACAVIVVATLYGLAKRGEWIVEKLVGKFLVPLGESSLYVYLVQAMLTFVLVNRTLDNWALAGLVTACMVGLVFLLVRNKFLFKVIPR